MSILISNGRATHSTTLAWMLIGLALLLTGCKPKDIDIAPAPLQADAPTVAALVAAQNERAAKLATTASDGVVELRWTDDRGKHSDQGDLDLWQTTENRTALRIAKLGEVGLWLGSAGQQWWLFDLMDKNDRVLHLGTLDQPLDRFGAVGVTPWALLDLIGITAIEPVTADADAPARYDSTLRAYMIEADGRGGRMRIAFDPATLLPGRIELLDADGRIVATSVLSRYESVPLANTAIMARPKMPRTIDIHREAIDGQGLAGDVKIAFNQTAGEINPRQMKSIFDVEALKASMRPDRVEQAGVAP